MTVISRLSRDLFCKKNEVCNFSVRIQISY